MFDFAWSEIALVGIVALIAIGPKDLPVAMKTVAELVKKARKMAGEFQTHVDEMVRDANLHEVRDQFNDLRRMDIKGKILESVDSDRTIRKAITENPMVDIKPPPPPVPVHDSVTDGSPAGAYTPALDGNGLGVPGLTETTVAVRPEHAMGPLPEPEPEQEPEMVDEDAALAFLPPSVAAAGLPSKRPVPPAFVPPAVVAASSARSAYASPYA